MTREKIIEAVRSAQNGDIEGFNTIYENMRNFVYARSCMYLDNEEDAKDLVQTVFLIAYMNLGKLSCPESIFAWLGAITFRQACKLIRDRKEVLLKDYDTYIALVDSMESRDPFVCPHWMSEMGFFRETLSKLIDKLPPSQALATVLYYYDEMTVPKIAYILGCPEGSVKSSLAYSKKKLLAMSKGKLSYEDCVVER